MSTTSGLPKETIVLKQNHSEEELSAAIKKAMEISRGSGIAAIAIERAPEKPKEITGAEAFEAMNNGAIAGRLAWEKEGVIVFKQIPATIPVDKIGSMQSLPQAAKDHIQFGLDIEGIRYEDQYIILWPNGKATYYQPSAIDFTATDWIVKF